MNTFSNSLFTFLFGWARSLIEGIWNAAAEGKYSAFFVWLGDHWLLVVILLCLLCTAADFLVWMIRWRPYLVWRTKLRRLMRRLRGEKVDSQRRFSQGYEDAVPLDLNPAEAEETAWQPEYEAAPEQAWQAENPAYADYDAAQEPLPEEYMPIPPAQEDLPPQEAPPVYPEMQPETPETISDPDDAAPRRRRRREQREKFRFSWHERLLATDDEDEGMLDGLPPVVDKQQAFHEPVYPAQQGVYTGWRRPNDEK